MDFFRYVGKLAGYTDTKNIIDTNAAPNRWGGAYPGVAQPDGTAFWAFREAGLSSTWNRGLGNLSRNIDYLMGFLRGNTILPYRMDSTYFDATGETLNTHAGATSNIDLTTYAAAATQLSPFYMYVGMYADPNYPVYTLLYGIGHPTVGWPVAIAPADVTWGGASLWPAFALGAEGLSAEVAIPAAMAHIAAPAGTIFGTDCLLNVGNWYNYGALVGAYIYISGNKNQGWYQISDIRNQGTEAVITKNIAKKVIFNAGDVAALITAGLGSGSRLEDTANNHYYYILGLDTTTDAVWFHAFGGNLIGSGASVNDVNALTVGDILTDITGAAVAVTVAVIEDVSDATILDIGAGSTTDFYVYAPPGYLPVGWGAGYPAALLVLASNPDPGDYELLCGHNGTFDEILRPANQVNPYGISLPTLLMQIPYLLAVASTLFEAAAAPFDFFRSELITYMENIAQTQAQHQLDLRPRISDLQGLTFSHGPEVVSWTSLWVNSSGVLKDLSADTLPDPGYGAGPETWYMYYDVSAQALAATLVPANIQAPDLPGGANDYPVGGDILIAVISSNAAAITAVYGNKVSRELDRMLPTTVGVAADNPSFTSLQEAFDFIYHFSTAGWKIGLLSTITETGTITISNVSLVEIYPITKGAYITWQPTADVPLFSLAVTGFVSSSLTCTDISVLNDFSIIGASTKPIFSGDGNISSFTLNNFTSSGDTAYQIFATDVPALATYTISDMSVVDSVLSTDNIAFSFTDIGTLKLKKLTIKNTDWTAHAAGAAGIYIDSSGAYVPSVTLDTTSFSCDDFANSYALTAATAITLRVKSTTISDYVQAGLSCTSASCRVHVTQDNTFSGSTVGTGPTGNAIYCNGFVTIKDNTFTNWGRQESVYIDTVSTSSHIADNEFTMITAITSGGKLYYSGAIASYAVTSDIRGNTIMGRAAGGYADSAAIKVNGQHVIDKNIITDWGASGPKNSGIAGTIGALNTFSDGAYAFTLGEIVSIWNAASVQDRGIFRVSIGGSPATLDGVLDVGDTNNGTLTWVESPPIAIRLGGSGVVSDNIINTIGIAGGTLLQKGIGIAYLYGVGSADTIDVSGNTISGVSRAIVDVYTDANSTFRGNKILSATLEGIIKYSGAATISGNSTVSDAAGIVLCGKVTVDTPDTSVISGNRVRVTGALASSLCPACGYFTGDCLAISGNVFVDIGLANLHGIYIDGDMWTNTGNIFKITAVKKAITGPGGVFVQAADYGFDGIIIANNGGAVAGNQFYIELCDSYSCRGAEPAMALVTQTYLSTQVSSILVSKAFSFATVAVQLTNGGTYLEANLSGSGLPVGSSVYLHTAEGKVFEVRDNAGGGAGVAVMYDIITHTLQTNGAAAHLYNLPELENYHSNKRVS